MDNRAAASIVLIILLCLFPGFISSQDYTSWVRFSDSDDNALVVELIEQGDLSTSLAAAEALGLREDFIVQEIILAVGEIRDSRPTWEKELILRTLLVSVFPASLDSSELEDRLRANREGIGFLVANLADSTLSLKREVIRLLGFFHPPESLSVLMSEGRRLTEMLRIQQGELNGEQAGLVIVYLEAIGRIGDPEFADIALLVLERCRHIEAAETARSVARSLLL